MSDFEPTQEQKAVQHEIRHGRDSVMIRAYAGCAKTTTLTLAAKEVKVGGLALAFNRHIKAELAQRFPSNFIVQTMNGLGHQSIMRAMPRVQIKLDEKKLGRLLTDTVKDFKVELSGDRWDECRQLVTSAMNAGLVPSKYDVGKGLVSDHPSVWEDLADQNYVEEEFRQQLIEIAYATLEASIEESYKGIIDYDDQVYFSVCVNGRFPQFPLLMVDEAQDLSPLNHEMVKRSVRPDGRLIVCGDEKQAIYGFRGADYTSMDKLRALRATWVELPLTMTFRCPKAVVARQHDHAPGFQAAPSNAEGTFKKLPEFKSLEDFEEMTWKWQDVEKYARGGDQIAVLCRNNAPLLSLAFKLLRQRIPVAMLGRDIGKGLVRLVKDLTKETAMAIEDFAPLVEQWKIKETSLAIANGKEHKVDGIIDRAECLEAVMSYPEVTQVGELIVEINKLFSNDKGRITLSSIHKAKGLEWDVVVLLDPWRIPSKQSKLAEAKGDRGPLIQELNLRYVAETRSKNVLLWASMGDYEA